MGRVAKTLMLINDRIANKSLQIYNNRVTDVVFEVEYFCKGWVKKDGVNANLALCDWPNFTYPH